MISDRLQALIDHALEVLEVGECDMHPNGAERWRGRCPLCTDRTLTLSVDLGRSRLWLDCWHATCDGQMIQEALGLTRDDLRLDEEPVTAALVRRRFDQIRFERVSFLVEDRVPLQGVSLLVGDPFAGKSTWSALLAAGVTTGVYGEPATVAILNAEDATEITTGPRVKAAGGDLSRVEELTMREDDYERVLTLPDDVPALEAWVQETRAKLLILDPLMMFLTERADTNQDHGVRRALASLAMMAARQRIAVLVCAHLNKDEQKRMLYRVGGSIGIVGLARSVLLLTQDPDDPDGELGDQRLLAHAATNWAKRAATLRYRVEEVSWDEDGQRIHTTKLVADGESDLTAEQIISPSRSKEPSMVEVAEDAICDALQDAPRLSSEVKAEVIAAVGCASATVQRAAAQLHASRVIASDGHAQSTSWHLLTQPYQLASDDDDEKAGPSNGVPLYKGTPLAGQPSYHHLGEGPDKAEGTAQNGAGEADNRARLEAELRLRERR